MKKISILIYSLGGGGAEKQVGLLLEYFSKKYKIYLVLMNETIFYNVPKSAEIVYIEKSDPREKGFKKLLKLPFLALKYNKFLKENNIDIGISFMIRPNYINALAKLYGSRVQIIVSERSCFSLQNSYKNLQSFINKKLVKLYEFVDIVVANSKGNAVDLKKFIKKDVFTIYNMLDLKEIEEKSKAKIELKKNKFTFVTIGRLDSGKNHKLLLEAIKDMDVDLWIIGDGELKNNLELIIDNLKLKGKVKLLGRQNNPYKFLSIADCFVFGSNHEGFPNVLLEALACGLPIISTDCKSGPREILAPNSDISKQTKDIEIAEYGILTPVKDVKKMTEAMQKILNDKQLRYNYTQKAPIRAKEFNVENLIKEWEKVLDGKF